MRAFSGDSFASRLSFSPLICISQPTNSDANLIFCPFFPIAKAKFSSLTSTSIIPESSSITIDVTSAGERVFIRSFAGSSSQTTMSILSLPNSLDTA